MNRKNMIQEVAKGVSNFNYCNNLGATKQLMNLFDIIVGNVSNKISTYKLETANDYIKMYDDHFYTYKTWKDLVESEVEQQSFGLTEEQLKHELEDIDGTVFQLPCGWYVQYV